jgi:hypothetical protein
MCRLIVFAVCGWAICLLGCKDPNQANLDKAESPTAETANNNDGTGIFGRTTQEISEYDPHGNATISDGQMKPAHPLNPLGALKAYGPTVEKTSKLLIQRAVDLFYAEHGRYPKDHQEFMDKVVHANQINLPELPGKAQYQYDVQKHELVVVQPDDDESDK